MIPAEVPQTNATIFARLDLTVETRYSGYKGEFSGPLNRELAIGALKKAPDAVRHAFR